jgi:hypothetical protein
VDNPHKTMASAALVVASFGLDTELVSMGVVDRKS